MGTSSPGKHCKVIAAFVSLSSHLIMHQIDVTSAHFSVAFNIPLNNISIYFSKLFSFRCLLIAAGTLTEYIVSQISKLIDPDPDPGPDPGGEVGTGHKNPVPKHIKYRKWISMTCFGAVLFVRLFLLIFLYFSSHLGYHVYVILSIESFFFGYFHASVLAIVPEHSLAVALAANASRFFILSIQVILDFMFYSRPLLMIKLQCWIGVILTTAAFTSWIYYHESETCNDVPALTANTTSQEAPSASYEHQTISQPKTKGFITTFFDAFSPFMMFFAGSMFKDFLFPGVLPYAVLHRDKCHIINMLVPVANLIGPIILFVLESLDLFKKWTGTYNVFWLLAIPMGVIFAYSMLAIHTRNPLARRIANSRARVMIITLGVVFGNGFLDPLSFGGVAKVVKPERITDESGSRDSTGQEVELGDNSLITFHAILALFMRYIFSKLSVGYNDTRVSLGYIIPKFRPNHKMSKRNLAWYLCRQTFKRAVIDAITDFQKNIQNYL
ncbi:conserved hypothetical protein [Theileria orientalis strain Shintoku]|uniref:Uncharacterized protein n=1 Tax=Theileria orientalis strain Shintoku TaxID=869250 RepID=J4C4B2_THEOR|nr:conserved hypothetical protein [Theileria orientalis strain Shintoku]BAM41881.1 conserved hypothetical protein [Theileria orientalis strain Shintoku]|eukprot:XP_009692182.1 conserved hypothetical protein [Theileria orientalis strain Shintoku]